MLYEIQRELFKQFKEKKHIQKQPHLALQLPEIVSHILSYLVIPYYFDELKKIKFYQHIYPCLFVNVLWHDCATRLVWRNITFEDIKSEYNAFNKFVDTVSFSSTSTTTLVIQQPKKMPKSWIMDDFNQDPLFLDYQHQPSIQSNRRHQHRICYPPQESYFASHRKSLCRNAIRSLTLRKIKDKTINEPLQKLSRHVYKLEKLDIYICDYISDLSVKRLIHGANLNLTYLSLAGCNRISDEAIIQAAHSCPKLEHLDLRACGLISDLSIKAVADHCPNLHHLNVGRVRDGDKITSLSINAIARQTRVAVLGLAGCDMTDECLVLMARCRAQGLERISVNNCYRITNKTVQAYLKYCPNLSVFEMKECHRVDDWASVADLVQKKVLLTLCEQQNRACAEWAKRKGRDFEIKAPIK